MTKCFVKEEWEVMGEEYEDEEGFEEEDICLGEDDVNKVKAARLQDIADIEEDKCRLSY